MRNILFLALGLITLFSCKKKEEGCNGNYAPISQSYLDYWCFKTGSTWIYKAQGQDLYDTVVVKRDLKENLDIDGEGKQGNQAACYIAYSVLLHHSYYNLPKEREEIFANGSKDNNRPLLTYRTKLKNAFPMYLYYENSKTEDSLQVQGVYYKNVLSFNDPQFIAFAPNIGIIKVVGEDSMIWELIEYKIED